MIGFHQTLCQSCGRPVPVASGVCVLCGSGLQETPVFVTPKSPITKDPSAPGRYVGDARSASPQISGLEGRCATEGGAVQGGASWGVMAGIITEQDGIAKLSNGCGFVPSRIYLERLHEWLRR